MDDGGQCCQPFRGVVKARDKRKSLAAVAEKLFLAGDGDFFKSFKAISDKSRADDGNIGDPLLREGFEQGCRIGFEPGLGAKTGLERDGPLIFLQRDGLGEKIGGCQAVVVVGISLLDILLGQTVEGEQIVSSGSWRLASEDAVGEGMDIGGMVEEGLGNTQGGYLFVTGEPLKNLGHPRPGGGAGVLGKQGEYQQAFHPLAVHVVNDRIHGGLAIAHGQARDYSAAKSAFDFLGLEQAVVEQGRPSVFQPYALVEAGRFFGPGAQDDSMKHR